MNMLTLAQLSLPNSELEAEKDIINNRFISDYQNHYVDQNNVKKRTAAEIIGFNETKEVMEVTDEKDKELLQKLNEDPEVLKKRSELYNSDKENKMYVLLLIYLLFSVCFTI